jgi:predicted Mrr-cat superfamily restriction endonuclease
MPISTLSKVHQFTTISPTHVPGKKDFAWRNFLKGSYVAIGWLQSTDLTGKSLEEIESLLDSEYSDDSAQIARASQAFERFLSLEDGDYIAIPNVNFGLFGVGTIRSGYRFRRNMHNTGSDDKDSFYSHYRDVEWAVKEYCEASAILQEGEKGWQPFGTIGKIQRKIPAYIARLVGLPQKPISPKSRESIAVRPEFLKPLSQRIEALRTDKGHLERDHESLVEEFFISIGYRKQEDLKFGRGGIDLKILSDGVPLAVVEVKRTWDLDFESSTDHIKQAYQYAHQEGIRYVIVTNGNDYLLFDRLKGLSWESNLVGEWRLSELRQDDLPYIDRLRRDRLCKPDLTELFQYLSESFGSSGKDS